MHDCSLSMLSDASKTRNTIIATNGNKYAAALKYLKQKDQVLRYSDITDMSLHYKNVNVLKP